MEVLRIWVKNLETKKEIRKRILKIRRSFDESLFAEWTRSIEEKIFEHPYFQEADHLCIYMSYNGEVGTDGIIRRATASGKRVWIPRVDGKDMEFYELRNRQELVRSSYGILEPPKGNQPLDMQDFQNCLMIMPGVAFDRQKNRIGYGGGYYDRYLSDKRELHTIAAAFEFQVLEKLPVEETDIRPDVLITEKNSY